MDVLHAIKRSVVESNYTFDPHTEPHYDVTAGQLTFCLIWTISVCLWVFKYKTSEGGTKNSTDCKSNSDTHKSDNVCKNGIKKESIVDIETGKIQNDDNKQENSKTETENETKRFCSVRPPPSTESFLKNVSIFGLIMFYFYLCDYRKIFPKLERVYDRDEFLFLVFLLFLVACAFTISKTQDKILNRDQTEEWKGWMQVMFVWYHVFAAKEWYNWIRVYIAAYVWMTGFGKCFSLYLHYTRNCHEVYE
ncbi:N-acetylneuraminate 9-O-acetyltransferase [Mactra antiquata]